MSKNLEINSKTNTIVKQSKYRKKEFYSWNRNGKISPKRDLSYCPLWDVLNISRTSKRNNYSVNRRKTSETGGLFVSFASVRFLIFPDPSLVSVIA